MPARDDAAAGGGSDSSNGATGSEPDRLALAEHMVFRPAGVGGFRVEQTAPGSFAVSGRGIEILLARYDLENDDALACVRERLRIGVLRALQARGYRSGDELKVGGVDLELDPLG